MNIVYLIGNGFDLAQGLKTSYNDFYSTFCMSDPINDVERLMIERIQGDHYEKWGDLEIALGEFTNEVTNKEDFEEAYYDLCDKLRKYLIVQNDGFCRYLEN